MVRVLADAYGLADRSALPDTIGWVQDRCWRGIEADADAGIAGAIRMREVGIVQEVRDCHQWTLDNLPSLRQALA
jgi:hypothetical protein